MKHFPITSEFTDRHAEIVFFFFLIESIEKQKGVEQYAIDDKNDERIQKIIL